MEESTRTKLVCRLLDASKLVPKLESMLRRLRAISILLVMRRDNTRSKITHTIRSFQEKLAAFEKRALDEMDEVFNSKSEYLDMYRDSVTGDIDSLRSLSSEVESLLRFTSGSSTQNHDVHAKRLIEVFSLVIDNNMVDLDVDDDIDCLDFVPNIEADILLNLGRVVSSYKTESCSDVYLSEASSPSHSDGGDVKKVEDLDCTDKTKKIKEEQVSPTDACLTGQGVSKTEKYPERKFKLSGKKLKNLGGENSSVVSRDIFISNEQEKKEPHSERNIISAGKKLRNLHDETEKSLRVSREIHISNEPEQGESHPDMKCKLTDKKLTNLGSEKSSMVSKDITDAHQSQKAEQLPERKFKLIGKKLKNLGNKKNAAEETKDMDVSNEQDRVEASQPVTYSSVVKCESVQIMSDLGNKDEDKNTQVEENNTQLVEEIAQKPIETPPPKEPVQEVQYVSSEDRKRWKKSLDDLLTNVPKPAFQVAAEPLIHNSKDKSNESSDSLTQEEDMEMEETCEIETNGKGTANNNQLNETGLEQMANNSKSNETGLEQMANNSQSKGTKQELTANTIYSWSKEAKETNGESSMQIVQPKKEVVSDDMLWEEELDEPVPDQVVPSPQLNESTDDAPDSKESILHNIKKEISPVVSKPLPQVYNQSVKESKTAPKTIPTQHAPTIRQFVKKGEDNKGETTIPAKLEVKLGHPGRGSGDCLHFPIGVTTDLEGNILVTDTGNHLVKVFDKDGQFKFTMGDAMVPAFTRPSAIVVNTEGKIFVKDDVCIHKFTSTGKYLCRLGAKKFNMPYGLALTSKGDLVTLDTCPRNPQIFIISPDGFYGTSYLFQPLMNCSCESKCRFLEVHNDTLYVSDLGLNCVYITDLFGNLLHTIGHSGHRLGLFSQAAGIALDKDGHMIVADSRNERIQVFRSNGKFLGVLALSDPHIRPSGIHLTPDGRLVVVNFTNHEVRVYRLCVQ